MSYFNFAVVKTENGELVICKEDRDYPIELALIEGVSFTEAHGFIQGYRCCLRTMQDSLEQSLSLGEVDYKLRAKRIRVARQFAGLTQQQACKLLHIHQTTLSCKETGRLLVRDAEIEQYSRVYGVDPSFITGKKSVVEVKP